MIKWLDKPFESHCSNQEGGAVMLAVLLSTVAAQISPICLYPAAFLYNVSQSSQIFTEKYSRVQIVTQLTAPNNTLINNKHLEPLIRSRLDHPRNRSIIRIKLLL